MTHLSIATSTPDRASFHEMLVEYYDLMINRNPPEVAVQFDAETITQDFWTDLTDYMPPNGSLIQAHDDDGALIGCAMMRKIRPDAAEFKRLYVRPTGRGLGLGRKMIQMRLDAARAMGLRTVLADTLRKNTSMQALYAEFGFQLIERYPESHTALHYPLAQPEMLYYQLDLTG